jgi:hypothetical protein
MNHAVAALQCSRQLVGVADVAARLDVVIDSLDSGGLQQGHQLAADQT